MWINNRSDLEKFLKKVGEDVIEIVLERLYNELLKNIDEIVYEPYNDVRKKYAYGNRIPTYEFRESWMTLQTGLNGKIYNEPESMTFDPEYYIHGSWEADMREALAAILNEGTDNSIFGQGWWTHPRPFWDTTVELLKNGTVDKWVKEAFKQLGISVSIK